MNTRDEKIWESDVSSGQKLVLLCLSRLSDFTGQCEITVSAIAEQCGVSGRAVQGHLKDLETAGHIKRFSAPGQTTVYRLL